MEQIDVLVRDLHRLQKPLATLQALLEVAADHDGVPAETRRCLEQMAVCVRELSDASTSPEPPTSTRIDESGESPDSQVVEVRDLEHRGSTLRELVGADLFEQFHLTTVGTEPPKPDAVTWLRESQARLSPANLTPQEERILKLVAQGCTNRQIAAQLYLAEKTVKNYVSNMLRKLGMERRTQAAVYAIHLHRAVLADATSGCGE